MERIRRVSEVESSRCELCGVGVWVGPELYDQRDRSHVAWDIETTGFGWAEEITVSGFWFPRGHGTLIINAGPYTIDQQRAEAQLAKTSNASVEVIVADDEPGLLRAMCRVIFDRFDRGYNRLVAYNAESWKGGFDLPFTRTRCIQHGVDRVLMTWCSLISGSPSRSD